MRDISDKPGPRYYERTVLICRARLCFVGFSFRIHHWASESKRRVFAGVGRPSKEEEEDLLERIRRWGFRSCATSATASAVSPPFLLLPVTTAGRCINSPSPVYRYRSFSPSHGQRFSYPSLLWCLIWDLRSFGPTTMVSVYGWEWCRWLDFWNLGLHPRFFRSLWEGDTHWISNCVWT